MAADEWLDDLDLQGGVEDGAVGAVFSAQAAACGSGDDGHGITEHDRNSWMVGGILAVQREGNDLCAVGCLLPEGYLLLQRLSIVEVPRTVIYCILQM